MTANKLWEHQQKSVARALDSRKYFALFHEQGTGKTRTMIEILRNLFVKHKRPLKTLILCPSIVVDNWEKEISRYSKCGQFVEKLQGTRVERLEIMKTSQKKIFVTNFEALHMKDLFWSEKNGSRVLIDYGFEMIIIDESQRLKSPSAKSTKLVIKMADKIAYRYLLSGTPILKDVMDVWSQFRVLDRGHAFGTNFYAFRNRFFIDKNAGMPSQKYFPDWQLRLGAEDAINNILSLYADRVKKEECLDLPPLVKTVIEIPMSKEQQKHYRNMEKDLVTYIGETASVANITLTKVLRCLQICSGFLKTDNDMEIPFKDNPRLNAVAEFIDDTKDKIIIWACFKQNYEALREVCKKLERKHELLVGGMNDKAKAEAVERFTKGDSQVLIANATSAGLGINLVEAPIAIWYSRTYKLEDRLQGLARNHRGGSEIHTKISCIDLVAPGTVEGDVLASLDSKEEVGEMILKLKKKFS